MLRRFGSLVGLVASLGVSLAAHAQWQGPPAVLVPKLFPWGEAPPNWNDTLMFRSLQLNLYWGGTVNGAHRDFGLLENPSYGPEYAAEYVIREIMLGSATQPPILDGGKVCLILQGIGEESGSYDEFPPNSPPPNHMQRAHRWFRPNKANASQQTPSQPNGDALENIPITIPPYFIEDTGDSRSDEHYKHPLVINSGLVPLPGQGPNGQCEISPMYLWMDRFCARYRAIQDDPTEIGLDEYGGWHDRRPVFRGLGGVPLTGVGVIEP